MKTDAKMKYDEERKMWRVSGHSPNGSQVSGMSYTPGGAYRAYKDALKETKAFE